MFSDEELPQGTFNITSSSVLSSGTIKIGQLFENKGHLKLKLHIYAMKINFEFKVKKSGNKFWYISYIMKIVLKGCELQNWRSLKCLRCGVMCLNTFLN